MTFHILSISEVRLLRDLIGTAPALVVLDINAVYVVDGSNCLKLEAKVEKPNSPAPHHYDEVFPIRVHALDDQPSFRAEGEPTLWYEALIQHQPVIDIEIIRLGVLFPTEELFAPSAARQEAGATVVDCGVLLHFPQGVVPAIQLHPAFGFSWAEKRLYSVPELMDALRSEGPYEKVSLKGAAQQIAAADRLRATRSSGV